MDFMSIAAMMGMPVEELSKLLALLFCSSFLLLLFMGLTNKVVVFNDGQDLFRTLAIVLVPLAGFIVLLYFIPKGAPDDYDIFWSSSTSQAVTVMTIGYTFYFIVLTFISSIKHNGLALGLVVGTFKVISSLVIVAFAAGWLNKVFGGGGMRSIVQWIIMTLVLGLFGWVIKKLVNGDAVRLKKMQHQES